MDERTADMSDDRSSIEAYKLFRKERRAKEAAEHSLRKAREALDKIAPAVENLACHQQQCDEDGVMVIVSRQAVDEVVNAINAIAIGPLSAVNQDDAGGAK